MAQGIRDKVAIVGMGCSRFGERWNCGPDDLMVEAFQEALKDAGIERDRIEAERRETELRENALKKLTAAERCALGLK